MISNLNTMLLKRNDFLKIYFFNLLCDSNNEYSWKDDQSDKVDNKKFYSKKL